MPRRQKSAVSPITKHQLIARSAAMATLLVTGHWVTAADYTWTGAGANNNLNTNANWSGNAAPPTGSLTTNNAIFAGVTRPSPNLQASYQFLGITFATSATSFNVTGSAGATLTLGTGGVTVNSSNSQTFSVPVILGGNQTWNVNNAGTLNVNSLDINTRSLTAAIDPGTTLNLTGPITGTGSLVLSGAGSTVISGSSSFTGTLSLTGGPLTIAAGATFTPSSIQVTDAGTGTTSLTINGTLGSSSTSFSLNLASGGSVTATLNSGGTLTSSSSTIGFSGTTTFNQNGGTHATGTLLLGSGVSGINSTYNLAGGLLTASTAVIGQVTNGRFIQSAGTATMSGTLFLGTGASGVGTVEFSGGTLTTASTTIGNLGTGLIVQSGGTYSTGSLNMGSGVGSTGTYSLSNGVLTANTGTVGYSGSATFNQTGGTATFTGALRIAYLSSAFGNYKLSGGTLTSGTTDVATTGTGTFTQSGGVHTTTTLTIASNPSGRGLYALAGGTLNASSIVLGRYGQGSFVQTGGLVVTNSLDMGTQPSSNGDYLLNGGTLQVSTITDGYSVGRLLINGGTLRATPGIATLSSSFPLLVGIDGAKLEVTGSNSTSLTATLASGTSVNTSDGGISKTGTGTLTLSSANSYTGPTTVSQGTLQVTSDAALGTNPIVNLQPGSKLLYTSSETTSRNFALSSATLGTTSGNTLTYLDATVSGGALSSTGVHRLDGGTTLNFVIAPSASVIEQTAQSSPTLNFVEFRGTLTQPAGATLYLNDSATTASSVVSISGTTYATGTQLDSFTTITTTGRLNANGGVTLGATSRTTIMAGGVLDSTAGPTALYGLLINQGTQTGSLIINHGGKASGAGAFGSVTVNNGGIFSPGNSPALVSVSELVLDDAGTLTFEVLDALGEPGTGFDHLAITGDLEVTSGSTPNSRFRISLVSLADASTPGLLSNFAPSQPYSWPLASVEGTITNFDPSLFTLDVSGFANPYAGSFSLSADSHNLFVVYTPGVIPEPSALLPVVAFPALLLRRKRR